MKISMTMYNFFPFLDNKKTKNDHEFSIGEDNDETLLLDDYKKKKKKIDVAIDYTYPQKSS